jgi:hypothetical protein
MGRSREFQTTGRSREHDGTAERRTVNCELENGATCRYVELQPTPQTISPGCMGKPYVLGYGSI